MKEWLLCIIVVVSSAYAGVGMMQPSVTKQPFRQFNSHWQQHQDHKLYICYQKMATMPEVKQCMLRLGVYI